MLNEKLTARLLGWTRVQRLSPDCEDQIRVILQESALDYRLDPQLQLHCSEEVDNNHRALLFLSASSSSPSQISRLCAEEAAAQEQTGQVEECLKVNLLKLKQDTCKKVFLPETEAAPPRLISGRSRGPR